MIISHRYDISACHRQQRYGTESGTGGRHHMVYLNFIPVVKQGETTLDQICDLPYLSQAEAVCAFT